MRDLLVEAEERKRTEEALRRLKQRLSKAFQSASSPVIISRLRDGLILDANRSLLNLVGLRREKVIGRTSLEIGVWASAAERQRALEALFHRGRAAELELKVPGRAGDTRDVIPSAVRIEVDGEPCLLAMLRDVTDHKRAEEALGESEKRFRQVLDVSSDMIYKLALESDTFDYISPSVLEMTGFTRAEFIAMGPRGLRRRIHPKDWPYLRRGSEEFVELGSHPGFEYRLQCKDGEYRWLSDNRALVRGEDGRPLALVGTVRDISERKQAEEALRESESRFRQVLEASSDSICRVSVLSGVCEYVSPAVLSLTGFTQEEFAALGVYGYRHRIHPDDWPQYRQRVEKLLAGSDDQTATRREFRWLCRDGQYRWFADSVALVRDGDGRPLAFVFTSRDTTERREAEEALRQSEERFRSLSASAPVGIFLADAEGKTVYANERLREIAGLTLEQSLGIEWMAALHRDNRQAVMVARSRAVGEGREYVREFRVVTPQGTVRWVQLRSRPMFSAEGEQTGRVGTVEDITEHTEVEERERRLREQEAHTRELRTTVRLLEQMAATLAHELRNPLGVISNSAYFLANQAGIEDPRVERHVGIIGREVASATRVIDDILEFAHVPQILPSPASLNAIVERALARSQVPANVRVARKLAVDLPSLVCDEERLERAFLDVIANAVQAMPHGGHLSVKTRPSPDGVAAVFCDNGGGIAPQNLAKIFDPMFTTKPRGIGLGLTVVRRTAEQHGGRVEVKSALGHGTTVIITLPLDCQSARSDDDLLGGHAE